MLILPGWGGVEALAIGSGGGAWEWQGILIGGALEAFQIKLDTWVQSPMDSRFQWVEVGFDKSFFFF